MDSQCDSANIFITVIREQFPPVFVSDGSEYIVKISELLPPGSNILTVSAMDQDLEGEIVYGTSGIVPAPTFFALDETTGQIYVQTDLLSDRRLIYTVTYIYITPEIKCNFNF